MPRMLLIDPAEAAAHGLPPVRVSASIEGLPLILSLYPDASTYASLSGPPGGALFFRVHPLILPILDGATLAARLGEWNHADPCFSLGPPGEIVLQGEPRLTQLYFTGSSHAACASCALVIQPPRAGASLAGLLLIFGHSGTPDQVEDCLAVAGCDVLAPILESMTWDFAVGTPSIRPTQEPEPSAAEPTVRRVRVLVPQQAPQQASAPAALLRFVGEIRTTMKGMNAWWDVMPDGEAFAAWTPLQQQLWSLQATLHALEPSLRQALERAPDDPVFGILEMLANWREMLEQIPGGAELAAVLTRGPSR